MSIKKVKIIVTFCKEWGREQWLEESMMGDFPGSTGVKMLNSQCRGRGLIPGQGTKIPHATHCGQKISQNNFLKI